MCREGRTRAQTLVCPRHNRIHQLLSLPTPRVPLYMTFAFAVIHCTPLLFVVADLEAIALRALFSFVSVVCSF